MSILWDIQRFVSKWVDKVRNVFKPNTVEKKDTLNDEINKSSSETGASNNDALFSVNSFNRPQATMTSFQWEILPIQSQSETSQQWISTQEDLPWYRKTALISDVVDMYDSITGQLSKTYNDIDEVLDEWTDKLWTRMWNRKIQQDANKEYRDGMERVYVWVGLNWWKNNVATYLSLRDEDRYRAWLAHWSNEISNAQESWDINAFNKAIDDMYNEMKWYFSTDNEHITDEDKLDKLSVLPEAKNMPTYYEPTKEQFLAFITAEDNNLNLQQNINKKYWLEREKTDEEKNIMSDLIAQADDLTSDSREKIRAIDWSKAQYATNNFRSSLEDQLTRSYIHLEPIFNLEKDILLIPEEQRTDSEKRIITDANNARTWLTQLTKNYADWYNRVVDETLDDKGDIADSIDYFKDWKRLDEVLKAWWIDMLASRRVNDNMTYSDTFVRHMSPIDIAEKFANDELYKYYKENETNSIKRTWNAIEHWWRPIWAFLSEWWQFANANLNYVPINIANLIKKWTRWSTADSYLDMDFSVWMLIETDDGMFKRNVKKYWYWLQEYAPEWLANIVPDMLLLRRADPWLITQSFKWIWNIAKLSRRIKALNNVNEVRKTLQPINTALKWLERVWAIWEQWANINSRNRRIWNIIDRWLAQFSVGQLMDAQLSVFDTEPYSDTSFYLSALWSLWLDILPELKSLYWVTRSWAAWWKALWKTTWVWDLVDFISQSEDNAMAIARAMWKKHANFTERELRDYVRKYAEISDAANTVYKQLTPEQQKSIWDWTKGLMYNFVRQTYWESSNIWKQVRQILINKRTNPADIIKYIWAIPWRVTFGPYASTIELKHWTTAWISSTVKDWWYDVRLDSIDWGFNRWVVNWFTDSDINRIASIQWFDDIAKKKNTFFEKVTEKIWDREVEKYYLKDKWLDRFWLNKSSLTAESLWVSLADAENVREILKERMKNLSWKNISDTTIDTLADGWWYDEVVSKIKEVLC